MYDRSRSNVPIDVSTAVTAVATFVEGFCGYLPTQRALLPESAPACILFGSILYL